jgi:hypothetical protein
MMTEQPTDPAVEAQEADERLTTQRGKWPSVHALAQWMKGVREENHFQDKIWRPAEEK